MHAMSSRVGNESGRSRRCYGCGGKLKCPKKNLMAGGARHSGKAYCPGCNKKGMKRK